MLVVEGNYPALGCTFKVSIGMLLWVDNMTDILRQLDIHDHDFYQDFLA